MADFGSALSKLRSDRQEIMNRATVSVLLVDKTKENSLLIDRHLSKIKAFQINLDSIETEAELSSAIASQKYDAYLIDSQFLARIDGTEINKIVLPVSPNPVIVITDNDEEGIAAIEAGAADYLVKNELTVSILERSLRLTFENNAQKNEISANSTQSCQRTIVPENNVDRHRTWLTTVVPIRDGTGKIVKLQGSAKDISEEKQAIAEQIRHTRHRYLLKSVTLKIRNSKELEKILKTTVTELQKTVQADRVLLFHFLEDGSGKVIEEAVVPNFPVMQGITMLDRYYRDNLEHKYTEGYVHCFRC